MNYPDSNLIIYAILDGTEVGDWGRGVPERMRGGVLHACTSFLTFDEVFYEVNEVKGTDIVIKNLEAFLSIPNMRFIDVNGTVIWRALELIRKYNIIPRGAIHAATAFVVGAETMFSQDKNFAGIKGLKREWMKR
ncbi:MAG: hypothetical protein C5S47_02735 [Candidatus Methanogasteraceae archaeon]|nr:MAG: hypothetical protein C5S47_02735 [ANME-2 cluster archaeon]